MPKSSDQQVDTSGRKRRTTSYDVAQLAGVSQSAVSRVFQQGASASEAMRDRVLAAADQLGYRPNAIARGLITQRSNMVAVVIGKQTNLFYPEVLVQLTQHLSERDIRVLLFTISHERDAADVLEQMLRYRVDGVIMAAMIGDAQLTTFQNAGIPLVLYNRAFPERQVNSVRCNQTEGERWLTSSLVAAGHRRFAIISGPEDSPVSNERIDSALQRLRDLGVHDVPMVRGDYSYASGCDATEVLLTDHPDIDAIIAANDAMAIGCIDVARDRFARRVPEDLSVVGFDGIGPARFGAYNLTTVRQPVGRMTEAVVDMLFQRIEAPDLSPEQRVFSGEFIAGGSARIDTTT
ncbi:MAG: LacI family DNA-binding transcriptional regulator [Pseudomonadota bacterium]